SPQTVDVLIGTLHGGVSNSDNASDDDCTRVNPGQHKVWVNTSAEAFYIESTIREWLGNPKFECDKISVGDVLYAKCWGASCDDDCGCENPQENYCFHSGATLDADGPCPTCGAPDATCSSCVKGQCLPRPTPLDMPPTCMKPPDDSN